MVTTFYPPYHFGGDATYVRALSRELAARGHEVEVVHCEDAYRLRADAPRAELPADDGVLVHRLHSRFGALSPIITQQTGDPGLKRWALQKILDRNFDVVNFHNISLVGGPGVLSMSHAPVNVYTTHEHWLMCPMHILWKNNEKACDKKECIRCCLKGKTPPQLWRYTGKLHREMEHVDALLCPSEMTAKRHREMGFAPAVHVLPLFSALSGNDKPFEQEKRPRFLFVGRVTAPKGAQAMLARFVNLPQYDLDVVGEGDLLAAMREKYAAFPHIRFHGQVAHAALCGLYQSATAVIFPSLSPETFGLTVVEGFAFGTPAITHDIGGASDYVRESGAGIVYQDPAGLDAAVHRLAASAATRAEMGRLARAAYLEHFTPEVHMTHYLKIIAAIRSRKPLPLPHPDMEPVGGLA